MAMTPMAFDDKWTLVDSKIGTTEITLPSGWKEVLCVCQYGHPTAGIQSNCISINLCSSNAITSYIYGLGSGNINAQVHFTASNKIQMNYFEVSGTNYTSSSKIYVYAR